MKSAEERARELLTKLGVPWSTDLLRDIALSFEEYARDRCHANCVNAPEPGKEKGR